MYHSYLAKKEAFHLCHLLVIFSIPYAAEQITGINRIHLIAFFVPLFVRETVLNPKFLKWSLSKARKRNEKVSPLFPFSFNAHLMSSLLVKFAQGQIENAASNRANAVSTCPAKEGHKQGSKICHTLLLFYRSIYSTSFFFLPKGNTTTSKWKVYPLRSWNITSAYKRCYLKK